VNNILSKNKNKINWFLFLWKIVVKEGIVVVITLEEKFSRT